MTDDGAPRGKTEELDQAPWRAPVQDQVAAPASREPDRLPFHERSWEDFERAVLVVAEHVDGMRGVRLYGVRGQAQRGIDLYGTDDAGDNVAYQPKRYVEFTPGDLEAAVAKFDQDERAVGAKRLVVCVGCDANGTEISEKLEELRARHAEFAIDLYDRRRLSELLKTRPDLVRRLFGEAWATAFCGGADWPIPEMAPSDVVADALIRGPVTAIGLGDDLDKAEVAAESNPAESARLLGDVIERLDAEGFGAFTRRLRLQRAELCVRCDDVEPGLAILAELTWQHVESGVPFSAHASKARLKELADKDGSESAQAFVAFADTVEGWAGNPHLGLADVLRRMILVRKTGHPLAGAVVLWLLETAVAMRDEDVAGAIVGDVDGFVEARAAHGLGDEQSVRLRAAKADVTGDWDDLVRDARSGRLGPAMGALALARHARSCARNARPLDAEADYQLAIQRACTAGTTRDAAAYVRAVLQLNTHFGRLLTDTNELLGMASDIAGTGTAILNRSRDPIDAGAVALSRNKLPEALRWYRTALRAAVIRGDLNEELNAHAGLADVLVRSGASEAAALHVIGAGSNEKLKMLLDFRSYVDVERALSTGPHWERAMACSVVAHEADLLPDDRVESVSAAALEAATEPRRSPFGPVLDVAAWKCLAALSERLSDEHASAALNALEPQIPREANHYRWTDDEHVKVVVGIALSNAGLQRRAIEHLVRIVEQGLHFAETAKSEIVRRMSDLPTGLDTAMELLADADNATALALLDAYDRPHPRIVAAAEEIVARELEAEPPPPGTFHFGTGLPSKAHRARVLDEAVRLRMAEHCMALAEDHTRPEQNRSEGMEGVAALARFLPNEPRDALFGRAIAMAGGDTAPSDVDLPMMGGLHPLSTMKVDLGWGSLRRDALDAAALLATIGAQVAQTIDLATTFLVSPVEEDVYAAARSISRLQPEQVSIDLRLLAAHPTRWVRQLAAVLSVYQMPGSADMIRRLATDNDPSVRRSLASGLNALSAADEALADEMRMQLLADPHWSVRHIAAAADPPV